MTVKQRTALNAAFKARAAVEKARERARQATAKALRELLADHTYAAAGALLGMSKQAAHKIVIGGWRKG